MFPALPEGRHHINSRWKIINHHGDKTECSKSIIGFQVLKCTLDKQSYATPEVAFYFKIVSMRL